MSDQAICIRAMKTSPSAVLESGPDECLGGVPGVGLVTVSSREEGSAREAGIEATGATAQPVTGLQLGHNQHRHAPLAGDPHSGSLPVANQVCTRLAGTPRRAAASSVGRR